MIPVFVDMDGTLIKGSTSSLEIRSYIKTKGLAHFAGIILKNSLYTRLKLKTWISIQKLSQLNYKFNEEIVTILRKHQILGNQLILATASPAFSTNRVISQSPIIFNEIISSNAHTNLKGSKKLVEIKKWLKNSESQDFVYIGNSFADLKIMKSAKESIFVGSAMNYFVGKYLFRIEKIQKISHFTGETMA